MKTFLLLYLVGWAILSAYSYYRVVWGADRERQEYAVVLVACVAVGITWPVVLFWKLYYEYKENRP